MKSTKVSLFYMIVAVMLVIALVVIGVSYAYLSPSLTTTNNIAYNLSLEGYSFVVTGNTAVNTTVNEIKMFRPTDNATNTAVFTSTKNLTINLTGYEAGVTKKCTYDVIWSWGSGGTYTALSTKEYTVSGTIAGTTLTEMNVSNSGFGNLLLGTYSISVTGATTTSQTASVTTKFYNLGATNQSSHVGKSFISNISVANVDCNPVPSTYQQVEYIQASGTQYIDTGLTISKTDKFMYAIKANFTTDYYGGANGYLQFKGGLALNTLKDLIVVYDGTVTTETIYSNGTVVYGPKNWSSYSGVNNKIGIFKMGNTENSWFSGTAQSGKIYFVKIYKDGTLVRNMVPVYRVSDSVIGMYDKVNGTFYTNVGTGTFTKGSNV